MKTEPGPVEALARLALQSERYQDDVDYRDAVDAVLGHSVYDAAKELLAALKYLVDLLDNWVSTGTIVDTKDGAYEQAKAAIAVAEGK